MKLAENVYFGIRIVISNGATKKNDAGGFKSAKLKGGWNRPSIVSRCSASIDVQM